MIMGHLNNSNSGSAMSSRFKGKNEEMFQEFHTINLLQKFNILSKRYDTNTGAFQYFQTQSVCLFYLSTLFQFPFILITVLYLENHKKQLCFLLLLSFTAETDKSVADPSTESATPAPAPAPDSSEDKPKADVAEPPAPVESTVEVKTDDEAAVSNKTSVESLKETNENNSNNAGFIQTRSWYLDHLFPLNIHHRSFTFGNPKIQFTETPV